MTTRFFILWTFLFVQVSISFVSNVHVATGWTRHSQLFAKETTGTPERALGILSFDLDDTLFKTTEVVRSANEKMIQTMIEEGCQCTLPDFLQTTKEIRKGLEAPLTYQGLRKRAIRQTFEMSPTFSESAIGMDLDDLVDHCYNAWENERHQAAERHLFPDAIETMKQLRLLYPKGQTCFVAITNGAGDPLKMPNTLAPFFDFRVSGEDDDVFPNRKPNPFIYEHALKRAGKSFAEGEWLHLGDCLSNDVKASASCGASAIWMCLESDQDSAASRLVNSQNHPEWSTATKEEVEARKLEVEAGKKFITATIYKLSELPDAISRVLEKSTATSRH